MVRALASHQCGPGAIPARCHMWVEFVVGSRPCSEGFSPGSPVFIPPKKTTLQIPFRSSMHVHVSTSSKLFGVTWVNKLHLTCSGKFELKVASCDDVVVSFTSIY